MQSERRQTHDDNVIEDPEAGSSNILDILRKVPGVSVDAEDNVKVKWPVELQDTHERPRGPDAQR